MDAQEEDSFDKSLNPITAKYLHNKITQNDSLSQIDLRHMCDNVISELESIENEASYDYLKFEKEITDMSKEMDQSDALLDELEDLLLDFKDHLGSIKSEMTSLQDRSVVLTAGLDNRKKLQKSLDVFINNVLLEPQLIQDICMKDVDEDYVQYIKILIGKLDYIKEKKIADMLTVKELEPELNKLKNKACQRVRRFLLEKLEMLKKSNTNFPILQNNVLIKFKVFLTFLREHYLEVFLEICNIYTETMSRLYDSKFRKYIKAINALISDVYVKTDTVIADNPQLMRSDVNTTATNIVKPERRSILHLMGRESILNGEENPIIINAAIQLNQKFTAEVVFRTVNHLLIQSVLSEYVFCTEFFSIKSDQGKSVANAIFKNTKDFIIEYFQNLFQSSSDSLAVLLALAINSQNKNNHNAKGLTILDSYFEKQNSNLWNRFSTLFDAHIGSMINTRPDTFRQLEKTLSLHTIIIRFSDLALSYCRIYAYCNDIHMLRYRLPQFKNQFVDLLKRYAREIQGEKEKIKFMLEALDFLAEQMKSGPTLEEDLRGLEKELETCKDEFVKCALKEYFEHLMDFFKAEDNQQLNQKLVENIARDFAQTWEQRVDNFHNFCVKSFSNPKISASLQKTFLFSVLRDYNKFHEYVKKNFQSNVWERMPNPNQITQIITRRTRAL